MVPSVEAVSSAAVFCTTSARRPQMKTAAPSCRKRSAIARPIPVPPPVIRMRLPFNRSFLNMDRLILEYACLHYQCAGAPQQSVFHVAAPGSIDENLFQLLAFGETGCQLSQECL